MINKYFKPVKNHGISFIITLVIFWSKGCFAFYRRVKILQTNPTRTKIAVITNFIIFSII
ncbi:hypothetical protein DBB36_09460 [Flavobacterium sp. WLB]|nr:hypothetical protein AKO67_00055 [Flavobacterium sp. VMW]OWU90749.1 hypothetical protein APR43_09710 [Flavobacterium sp. NLM]PUU70231.1 hypothetical protein DBB36_09460 [Flavobacterium sp. WLB]